MIKNTKSLRLLRSVRFAIEIDFYNESLAPENDSLLSFSFFLLLLYFCYLKQFKFKSVLITFFPFPNPSYPPLPTYPTFFLKNQIKNSIQQQNTPKPRKQHQNRKEKAKKKAPNYNQIKVPPPHTHTHKSCGVRYVLVNCS